MKGLSVRRFMTFEDANTKCNMAIDLLAVNAFAEAATRDADGNFGKSKGILAVFVDNREQPHFVKGSFKEMQKAMEGVARGA